MFHGFAEPRFELRCSGNEVGKNGLVDIQFSNDAMHLFLEISPTNRVFGSKARRPAQCQPGRGNMFALLKNITFA